MYIIFITAGCHRAGFYHVFRNYHFKLNDMLIETMPSYLGQQLYPYGYPLPPNKISVNGKTMAQLYIESEIVGFYKNVDNVSLLEDYYRYFLLCPCWDLWAYTEEDIMSADYSKLFDNCMDLGVDPTY